MIRFITCFYLILCRYIHGGVPYTEINATGRSCSKLTK